MFRRGVKMTIGKCSEDLVNKSTTNFVKEIIVIENKKERIERFEEAFI